MAIKVLVPLLGEGVEEVTISKWLKQEGETVKEMEPLVEVNTDKVDTEIPAPASGTLLKIEMQEGQPAKVGQLLAVIGEAGEKTESAKAPSAPPAEKQAGKQAEPVPMVERSTLRQAQGRPLDAQRSEGSAQPSSKEVGFISPVVARIAAEKGVNLDQVSGTGLNGRITKNDVLKFAESGRGGEQISDKKVEISPTSKPAQPVAGDQLVKHTVIRKQIAEHMVMSMNTSPHVLTVMEADMSKVLSHRAANKEIFGRDGVNLTITAYFISSIVTGLKAYPFVNSTWTNDGVLVHQAINIGMATSLGEEGLIVPVIKKADDLSLLALARAINDLGNRARTKKLQPDDVKGGTFTLTNHGTAGSLFAMPIINQPQSGILGTGAMQKRAVVVEDAIAIRPMVYLSFVFDHRILDGASADAFLAKIQEALEAWA